jgi:hypothetical protein
MRSLKKIKLALLVLFAGTVSSNRWAQSKLEKVINTYVSRWNVKIHFKNISLLFTGIVIKELHAIQSTRNIEFTSQKLVIRFHLKNLFKKPASAVLKDLGNTQRKIIRLFRFTPYEVSMTDILVHTRNQDMGKISIPITMVKLSIQTEQDEKTLRITDQSTMTINSISSSFFMEYDFAEEKSVRAGFDLAAIRPSEFLQAFRFFSFKEIYQVNPTGTLSLIAEFVFSVENPLEYLFAAKLDTSNLKLRSNTDLQMSRLDQPFRHQMHKHGTCIFDIELDEHNELFTVYEELAPSLINTIILTEDWNFYRHKGVDPHGFGFAIATNIAERKFARGGSTLTMQLVRNLFLNHSKSISRKVEEIIIAWLLENHFSLSKKRIIELYLNVIEFAPGIYGIKQAAAFYFGKAPSELTVTDSLILSYIIPRPRHFLDALRIRSSQLEKNLANHVGLVSRNLLNKKKITDAEYEEILKKEKLISYLYNMSASIK